MKKSKITFLVTEILLAILTIFFVINIFSAEKPQKRVAVIVENSGDERWENFIDGMKQAASLENIHLIICNTDEIENAQEEKNLINEQLKNNVDAFIIQAAPGYDVSEMLQEVLMKDKPFVLVVNDALTPEIENDIHAVSNFPKIMPDNYEMGYQLGMELLQKNENDIRGKTVGIVGGIADTDSAKKRQRGLEDALDGSGCKILWRVNTEYGQSVAAMVKEQEPVDFIAALESGALEQLGEMKGSLLYGISRSGKSIYYLDTGMVEGLVIADEYYMGYRSVVEISQAMKQNLYIIQNHTVEIRAMQKEDIFTEENQNFFHAYE